MTAAKPEAQSAENADVRVQHASLAEALAAVQAELPAVDKDSVNPHFKSRFTSLDHLIAKTRPVANRHGVTVTQWPTFIVTDGIQPIHALQTRVQHVSGEFIEATMPLILGKADMQGLGSALTYAKRYMWAAALGVSTDEDDDGNAAASQATGATERPQGASTQPRTPPKPQNASQGVGLITDKQMKLVGAVLRKLGDGGVLDEDGYRAKLNEMNVDSTRDLTGPQASVLIDWLKELEAAMDVEL